MNSDQEPTLGEIMRGQARIEGMLHDFIDTQTKRNHVFADHISGQNVAIALHAQKLADLALLEEKLGRIADKVDGVISTTNTLVTERNVESKQAVKRGTWAGFWAASGVAVFIEAVKLMLGK